MASYLRPRRGKKATALSQNITLKAGEVFFETPTTGVGTGAGRIMMGNGSNNYTYLNNNKKAFITDINCPDCYISNFTATAGNTTLSNNDTYLNNMKPGATASTFFTNLWTLLSSHNKQLTQLNNDLVNYTLNISRDYSFPSGINTVDNLSKYGWINISIKYGSYIISGCDIRMTVFIKSKLPVIVNYNDGTIRSATISYKSDTSINISTNNCDYVYIILHN